MPSYLLLGGSRNIGHHIAHLLLHSSTSPADLKLTLLLRRDLPADDTLVPFVTSGQVTTVKGDATIRADMLRAWEQATNRGGEAGCDTVVYAIGGRPRSRGRTVSPDPSTTRTRTSAPTPWPTFSPSSPLLQTPRTETPTSSPSRPPASDPRATLVSLCPSKGCTPGPSKPAHEDKIGLEHLLHLATASGPRPLSNSGMPSAEILPHVLLDELQPIPREWALSKVTVVRPALLMDEPKLLQVAMEGGKKGYRAEVEMWKPRIVAREEVARFVVEECLGQGEDGKWVGKQVDVAKKGWWIG